MVIPLVWICKWCLRCIGYSSLVTLQNSNARYFKQLPSTFHFYLFKYDRQYM
eukprot:jgi/Botrbrau1/20106/Bobra.0173s0009.1